MTAEQENQPPTRPRRSLLRGASWFGSFTGLFMLIRLVRGAVIPKILPPGPYGLWSAITVVQRYLVYADLGVLAQYRKRFPRLIGEGKEEEARVLEGKTMGLVTIAAVVVAVGLAAAGLGIQSHREFYLPALLMMATATLMQRTRYVTFAALGARERFKLSSISASVFSLTDMVAAISLVWVLGVIGLPAGLLVGEAVTLLFLLKVFRPPRPRMPDRAFIGAIGEGLLLLGVQFSGEFLFTSDRIMLVSLATPAELGLYSLSMFGLSMLLAPSGIFLTVLQPRIMKLTGAGEHLEARKILEAGLALYLLLSMAVVIVALPSFSILLSYYFTNYAKGMVAAYIIFSLVFFEGSMLILRVYYLALNRERVLVVFQLVSGVVGCALSGTALSLGHGIAGVAVAAVATQVLFACACWIYLERKGAGPVGAAKYLILAGAVAVYIGLASSLAGRPETGAFFGDIWQAAWRAGVALAAVLAGCLVGRRWIMQTARPFFKA